MVWIVLFGNIEFMRVCSLQMLTAECFLKDYSMPHKREERQKRRSEW